jgi:N-acetylmuramoyl-L-alanine amidase
MKNVGARSFFFASLLFLGACISPQPKLYQTDSNAKPAAADTSRLATIAAQPKPETIAAQEPASAEEVRAQFNAEGLAVKILLRADESFPALGKRILHHPEEWHLLPRPPAHASHIDVPFTFLNYAYKKRALAQVFPKDAETDSSWMHVVNYADETWGSIAEIFSGDEDMADLLLLENGFEEEGEVRLGQSVKIPGRLLQESLRRNPLVFAAPQPEVKTAPEPMKLLHSQDPELKLVTRGGKTYGVYRLKRGEALYSAVVVRFTGRVDADEVNQIARELLVINGIADASKIAIGAEIKIPLALLDEGLLGEEPLAEEPAPAPPPRRGRSLHVILDAGHGGEDPGTVMRDLREDEIAYDLMRRIREGLEANGAKVHALVSANGKGEMGNGYARKAVRHEYVNVTPAYYIADGRIGVNLRIYLIEAIYRRLLREGAAAEDIIFMSIHLDHLHPSVGGAMIYVPGASQRAAKFKASEAIFDKYHESRDRTLFFGAKENRQAEAASLALSRRLMAALRKARLPIHAHQPIRKYVYRGGKKWTPGIIRYNRVPTALLLEAANFSNREDQKRIRSTQFRRRFAEAIVQGIMTGR